MLAGNETSATALTWTLYLLTQNPEAQDRLRKECLVVTDERPSLSVNVRFALRHRLVFNTDAPGKRFMACHTWTLYSTKPSASSRRFPAPFGQRMRTLFSPWAPQSRVGTAR